jgi:hypothetical protein
LRWFTSDLDLPAFFLDDEDVDVADDVVVDDFVADDAVVDDVDVDDKEDDEFESASCVLLFEAEEVLVAVVADSETDCDEDVDADAEEAVEDDICVEASVFTFICDDI